MHYNRPKNLFKKLFYILYKSNYNIKKIVFILNEKLKSNL